MNSIHRTEIPPVSADLRPEVGVSRAGRKYNKSRSYIYFWRARYDGSLQSLACNPDVLIATLTSTPLRTQAYF